MKNIIIIFAVAILCTASFLIGSRYTILNQRIEIKSETQVNATIFGNTDVYYCE